MGRQSDGERLGALMREIAEIRRELRELREMAEADRFITTKEAAELLACSRSKVYSMIKAGFLPARQEGRGRIRLSLRQVRRYIRK